VLIGGLITSTFLSLLVIPVVYSYIDDLVQWIRQRIGRSDTGSFSALPDPRELTVD
jgi:hypothetical protein